MNHLLATPLDGLSIATEPLTHLSGNEGGYRNLLLTALKPAVRERIAPHLRHIELVQGDVLQESGVPIEHVYFVESGLVSVVTDAPDGTQIEIGVTAHEGVVGAIYVLGQPDLHRSMVQVPGEGYQLPVEFLEDACRRDPVWRELLLHYVYVLFAQSSRSALCNRTHTVEERLSRWLLTVRDRIQSNRLPLTDQFVAHMLGVRRSSVTVALGVLQQAGLIDATRGDIVIIDQKIERTTCECYHIVRHKFECFETEASV